MLPTLEFPIRISLEAAIWFQGHFREEQANYLKTKCLYQVPHSFTEKYLLHVFSYKYPSKRW